MANEENPSKFKLWLGSMQCNLQRRLPVIMPDMVLWDARTRNANCGASMEIFGERDKVVCDGPRSSLLVGNILLKTFFRS